MAGLSDQRQADLRDANWDPRGPRSVLSLPSFHLLLHKIKHQLLTAEHIEVFVKLAKKAHRNIVSLGDFYIEIYLKEMPAS